MHCKDRNRTIASPRSGVGWCVLLLAVLSLALVACGAAEEPTATPVPTATPTRVAVVATPTPTRALPTPTPTPAVRVPAGTVTVVLNTYGREVWDPALGSTTAVSNFYGPLYDFFIRGNPKGELTSEYGLLQGWEMNALGDVYTLKVKPGVRWHDGTELSSSDIAFTFARYNETDAVCVQCGTIRGALQKVETPDQYTAVVYLKAPDVSFVQAISSMEGDLMVLPKAAFERAGKAGWGDKPVGTGPYRFVSWKVGQNVEFEANREYWKKERIPGFDRMNFTLVPEAGTRVAMLKTGQADVAMLVPGDVAPLVKAGFAVGGPKEGGHTMVFLYGSYMKDMLTNRLEFRKALNLAIDRNAIADSFYPPEVGAVFRGNPPWCPGGFGYDPDLPAYPYDPEEAKQLLKASGYAGETVTFYTFTLPLNPEQMEVNEAIASYWSKVGINVKLVPVDYGSVVAGKRNAVPQGFVPPVELGVQPLFCRPSMISSFRVSLNSRKAGGASQIYWNQEKADRYYNEVKGIVDPVALDNRLREINRELYEEYWTVPLVMRTMPIGFGPRVAASEYAPTRGTFIDLAWDTLRPR